MCGYQRKSRRYESHHGETPIHRRAAKMAWCAERGLNVVSLQHDGIVIDALPDGLSADEAAELMSSAASRAAGYEVVVEAKGIAMPLIVD